MQHRACITAMSPSRTVKCITCMNQVVISNLWGSLAFRAHVWLVRGAGWSYLLLSEPPPQQRPVLFLNKVYDTAKQTKCTCAHSSYSIFLRKRRLCNYEMQLCFSTKHPCLFPGCSSTSAVASEHDFQLVLTCVKHQMSGSHSSPWMKCCLKSSQVQQTKLTLKSFNFQQSL